MYEVWKAVAQLLEGLCAASRRTGEIPGANGTTGMTGGWLHQGRGTGGGADTHTLGAERRSGDAVSLKPSSPVLGTHVPRSARGNIDVTENTQDPKHQGLVEFWLDKINEPLHGRVRLISKRLPVAEFRVSDTSEKRETKSRVHVQRDTLVCDIRVMYRQVDVCLIGMRGVRAQNGLRQARGACARNPRMKRHERVQDTKSARIGEAALSVRRERMYSKWMEEWLVKGLNTRSRVGGTETRLIQSQNHCLLRKSDPPRLGGYDASRADLGWLEKRKLQNLRNGHSPVKDRGGQYFEVSVRLRLEDNESVATKSKKMNPNPRLPELEAKAKAFGLRG
ncbi:hypothetical protein B0H13DRAFT_1926076 [Mycena leptocephala]|nr:hypothetical protein B0H13DRAFT_1926076 [Mycena leptocephala]